MSTQSSSPGEALAQKLHKMELAHKEEETQKLGASLGIPAINLVSFPIDPDALTLIPEDEARASGVVCFFYNGKETRIAALDPMRSDIQDIMKRIGEKTHTNTGVYITSQHSIESAFRFYATLPHITPITKGVHISESELKSYTSQPPEQSDLSSALKNANTSDVVTQIIALALARGSSDVHIEAEEVDVKVRVRIDGVLYTIAQLDASTWERIISRIKLLSSLKLNITTEPQDGRFNIALTDESIDVRVSTIPTAFGESVVMRILRSSAVGLRFEDLGIRGKAYDMLAAEVKKPNGMILTTGPTGSGKTTTLYAILTTLNDEETKIITLEDPIEYKLKGVNQSQIDASRDYTFAKGLRSILRQDPDIVMVGEIRDEETVDIAVQAALTGHLVLSTVHTNSAAGAIPRFLSMGAKPYLLAPSLNAIIGQRLVRKVCQACAQPYTPTQEELRHAEEILASLPATEQKPDIKNAVFKKGAGCAVCSNTGYKGRIGIYEVLTMSKDIEEIILSGKISEYDAQAAAQKQGMVTMAQDGILKAIDGITTIAEVLKVAE